MFLPEFDHLTDRHIRQVGWQDHPDGQLSQNRGHGLVGARLPAPQQNGPDTFGVPFLARPVRRHLVRRRHQVVTPRQLIGQRTLVDPRQHRVHRDPRAGRLPPLECGAVRVDGQPFGDQRLTQGR